MAFKKEVIEKLDKINIELALNTRTLEEHHVRSSNLESRVKPLEESHVFFNKLAKALMAIVSICAGIAAILKFLVFK